jgi:hypothetical protein
MLKFTRILIFGTKISLILRTLPAIPIIFEKEEVEIEKIDPAKAFIFISELVGLFLISAS